MRKIFSILFALVLALGLCLVAAVPAVASPGVTTVLVDNLQPSWTAPGGGGVFSAYVGPPAYGYVSPGTTAVYLGREAGIIKAGLLPDPGDGHYWDEGLFGFKPTVTIDDFAAGTLTYDVVNQEGTNPVWMTIEIDTGVVDNRLDNTAYQHVPTTNPAGWHTVNAAAGLWQQWTNYTSGITTGPLMTLSQVAGNNTGLNVVRAYLRLGMGDSYHGTGNGTVGWVDKATLGGVTYDFVVPTYWYVAKTGLDTNEGTLASPFLTIQHAVGAAGAGDTIHVATGTYNELVTINKALSLQGSNYTNTIIDRSASAVVETVVTIKDIPSGNVLFTGFKIINGVKAYATSVKNCSGSSVITISDNYIQGQNADNDWGLIAGYGNQAKVVVTHNIFDDTYNNEILFEKQVGETEVSYNTFTGAFPAIYYMSSGGVNVTTPQVVKNNMFEMQDADPTWHGSAVSFVGSYYRNIEGQYGDGKFTNVTITENMIQNLPYTDYGNLWRGITLANMDQHGDGGLISGASITKNTITGKSGNNAIGIRLFGKVINTVVQGNVISSLDKGILGVPDSSGNQYPQTTTLNLNNIAGNTFGVDWPAASPVLDALYNWWGDKTGPSHDLNLGGQGDAVSDNVDFSPWLYKTQEQFVSGAPCYAGSVVLDNEATEIDPGSYAGGWNSFSTPITLDGSADSVSELLALTTGSGLFIERAQRFDLASQTWVPVIMGNVVVENYPIKPGEGLFIQVSSGGSIPILVKTTPTSPPMRNLVAGWNLIGMSSLGAETVTTALSGVSYSVVLSPKPPNDVAWSVPPAGAGAKELLLGEAYWVAMGGPGILFGFTTTPVADDMTWELNQ
jgi:hypothetical protein